MHLSMLSCWRGGGGGRPGKGGGFELRSSFQFKYPTPRKLTVVKRVQILHLYLAKSIRLSKKKKIIIIIIKHKKVVNKTLQSNNFKMQRLFNTKINT